MSEPNSIDEFLQDVVRSTSVRLEIELAVAVADSGRVRIGAPFGGSLVDVDVEVRNVDVSALLGQVWHGSGRFVSEHEIAFDSCKVEAARSEIVHVSRSSKRLEHPECKVWGRPGDTGGVIEAECLDLSAGGAGVHLDERLRLGVGDPFDLDLEIGETSLSLAGFVAHVVRSSHGTRVGIQFAPMAQSDATVYFDALNALAGEVIADIQPNQNSVPEFFRVLSVGTSKLCVEVEGEVVGDRLRLATLTPTDLAAGAKQLVVHSAEGAWTADVHHVAGELVIHQVERASEHVEVRGAGYRVAAPLGSRVAISREGAACDASLIDLSRGGIGFVASGEMAFEHAESLDIELMVGSRFTATLRGQVAYVRRIEEGTRVGVVFVGLSSSMRDELNELLSSLEDREVLGRVALTGALVFAFLVLLIVFGTMISPARDTPNPEPPSNALDSSRP